MFHHEASSRSTTILACVILLCQAVTGRSLIKNNGTSRTSVTLEKNTNWEPFTKTNTSELARAYNKFGIPMSPRLQKQWNREKSDRRHNAHLKDRDDGQNLGKVTASSGGYYVFPVSIGTPSQTFNILFDTGSSDFWVFGSELPLLQNISAIGHTFFDSAISLTSEVLPGKIFNACYGDGSCVQGDVSQDTITVGSLQMTEMSVPLIYQETDWEFDQIGLDGILGLGLASLEGVSPDPATALPAWLLPQLWSLQGFTVTFVKDGTGTVDFAYIDSTKYLGDITYTPVSTQGPYAGDHWVFDWAGFSLGEGDFNTSSVPVLTDTGNANMFFPPSIVALWQSTVSGGFYNGQGVFVFRCIETELPDFTFGIGESRFTIYGAFFLGPVYELGADGFEYCTSTFFSSAREDVVIAGMPLFQNLFVVHDLGQRAMGFASRNDTGFEPVADPWAAEPTVEPIADPLPTSMAVPTTISQVGSAIPTGDPIIDLAPEILRRRRSMR